MRSILPPAAAFALLFAVAPSRALAGGLEYVGQGAQALGRGGAVTARADDPMVLSYNPAGLAELRGSQFLLNLNLALFDACVDAYGYYGWGVYLGGAPAEFHQDETGALETLQLGQNDPSTGQPGAREAAFYTDPLDTVCLDQNYVPLPQIAWTRRISEDLGIGFGFLFPPIQPSGRWGGRNGIIRGDTGELRPAPTRYQLLASNNLGLFPTVGAGYRLFDAVRIGLAFEWGIIAVNNFTMSSSSGGTAPHQDIVAHVKAQDWFIPAITASLHFVPVDAIDFVVAFRYQDELEASGDIDLTTGLFHPGLRTTTTGDIPIRSLTQGFPWKLRAGLRYSDRLAPRAAGTGRNEADYADPDRIHDPLQDEHWDIEIDVEYQLNSKNDRQVLDYAPRQLAFVSEDPMQMPAFANAPVQSVIEKHWKDQLSIRAGGTLHVLPGLFGISAGAHYETRGVDPSYMQVDFWPVSRVGLHAGMIIRVEKSIDLVFSYAHIFQETITVTPPPHQVRQVVAACWAGAEPPAGASCLAPAGEVGAIDKSVGTIGADRSPPPVVEEPAEQRQGDGQGRLEQQLTTTAAGQPPYVINSGRYRSSFDVIAVGVNVHF